MRAAPSLRIDDQIVRAIHHKAEANPASGEYDRDIAMRPAIYPALLALLALATLTLDAQQRKPGDPDEPTRLPNGKLQQDEMLKADHEKDVADARDLARLANELKEEMEKGDAHVLSIAALKKTDDIEKLAKRIRGRIRRY